MRQSTERTSHQSDHPPAKSHRTPPCCLFCRWCEEKGVAANLMLGRRIPSPCTPSDLRDLLQGEPIAEDGPFQGGRLQAFSKRQVDALGLTEEEACRGRRHTFSFNPSMNLHYNGLLAAWRQGNFRPIMLRSM